jgi:CheY-like chemotaxis protein
MVVRRAHYGSEAQVDNQVGGKPRVLIVEDEPIAREILADLLRMAGYQVLSEHSGEQALLTLLRERGRIACLLTAVELPGLVDGWMLAEEFRVSDAALPVVFAVRSKPAKARRVHNAAFVTHPVLPPKAVEAVKKLTGRQAVGGSRQLPQIVAEAGPPQLAETPRQAELVNPVRLVG